MEEWILCCLIKDSPIDTSPTYLSFTNVLIKILINLVKARPLLVALPSKSTVHLCFLSTWLLGGIKCVGIEYFYEHLSAVLENGQFQKQRKYGCCRGRWWKAHHKNINSFLSKTIPSSAEIFVRRDGTTTFRHGYSEPDPPPQKAS